MKNLKILMPLLLLGGQLSSGSVLNIPSANDLGKKKLGRVPDSQFDLEPAQDRCSDFNGHWERVSVLEGDEDDALDSLDIEQVACSGMAIEEDASNALAYFWFGKIVNYLPGVGGAAFGYNSSSKWHASNILSGTSIISPHIAVMQLNSKWRLEMDPQDKNSMTVTFDSYAIDYDFSMEFFQVKMKYKRA